MQPIDDSTETGNVTNTCQNVILIPMTPHDAWFAKYRRAFRNMQPVTIVCMHREFVNNSTLWPSRQYGHDVSSRWEKIHEMKHQIVHIAQRYQAVGNAA